MVLNGELVIPLLVDVCQGLSFLHSSKPPLIHGDLKSASEDSGAAVLVKEVVGDRVRDGLRDVKSGLQSILQILAKDGVEAAELELVPPSPAEKKKTVAKAAKRK